MIRDAPWGQEIVVCRRVSPREITAIRDIRQDVGWVETPDTVHKYECVCALCLPRGSPDLFRRCRAAFNNGVRRAHSGPRTAESILEALYGLDPPLERAGKRLEAKKLMSLARHDAPEVRRRVAWLFGHFRKEQVLEALLEMLADSDHSVRSSALDSSCRVAGPLQVWDQVRERELALVAELIEWLEFWPRDAALDLLDEIATSSSDDSLSSQAAAARERVLADLRGA